MTVLERVKQNETAIKKAMTQANWDALINKHLRFVLYLHDDDTLSVLQDVAGGNSYYQEGNALKEYCWQYSDGTPSHEQKCYKEIIDDEFDRMCKDIRQREEL